jgi:hypothetical protein
MTFLWPAGPPGSQSGAAGLESGIWFRIRQGVRGVLVRDERGRDVVYVVCEPAHHDYGVMTKSRRMPVLVGEVAWNRCA